LDEQARREEELQMDQNVLANFLHENLIATGVAEESTLMRPLSEAELRKIKLEKTSATKTKTPSEPKVCSICCDEIPPKTLVRRMPECKHMFH
jgi:hypothetical protein